MKTQKQPSPDAPEEFRAICEEGFGKSLSDEEVRDIARRLLHILEMLRQSLSDGTSDQPPINGQVNH